MTMSDSGPWPRIHSLLWLASSSIFTVDVFVGVAVSECQNGWIALSCDRRFRLKIIVFQHVELLVDP